MPRRNRNVTGKHVKSTGTAKVVDSRPPKLLKNKNRVAPGKPPVKPKQPYTNQYGSSKG